MQKSVGSSKLSVAAVALTAALVVLIAGGWALGSRTPASADSERAASTSDVVAEIVEKSDVSAVDSDLTTIVLGYYEEDPRFQSGLSDEGRKSGLAYD